jgi:uncharacterized protein YkwD
LSDADLPIASLTPKRHRAAVARLVDDERRAQGLPALRHAGSLRLSAMRWARWIVRHSRFTHGDAKKRFRGSPYARIARARGDRWLIGEALAWGIGDRSTPRSIVAAWMASPHHRALVLGQWKHRGVWSVADAPLPGSQPDGVTVVFHFGWRGPR